MTVLDDVLTLVRIESVSGAEAAIAEYVASRLRANPRLQVERVGDNVVARTTGLHATRLVIAGHLDTVPGDASAAHRDGDAVVGLGACDMKGSLAAMLELATRDVAWPNELTWIFYAREEIARSESGLRELLELRPDLLVGDVAVLAEPTGGVVEVGCQGMLRLVAEVRGRRAHTARPYMGRNAIHRLAQLVARVAAYTPRTALIDGVEFTEQLQVVAIEGGVASNVVPDVARCVINHRFAPDRTYDEAERWFRDYVAPSLEPGDRLDLEDWAPAAPPGMNDVRLRALVALSEQPARAKVGWTDVATFAELGIPATNFGAGDPLLAHHPDERVSTDELANFSRILSAWVRYGGNTPRVDE